MHRGGQRVPCTEAPHAGQELDEAAVYDGALPEARILNHYTTIKGAPEAVEPIITLDPAAPENITYVGSTVTLTADVSGSLPLTFQWKKNGANVPGATSHTLTLSNGAAADSGCYTLAVTNGAGSAESQPADVAFVPSQLPVIDAQPENVTSIAGLKATFTVQASGALALTYQWQKGTTDIPGATGATYTIDGVTAADAGAYRVIVSTSAGSTPSRGSTHTPPPHASPITSATGANSTSAFLLRAAPANVAAASFGRASGANASSPYTYVRE